VCESGGAPAEGGERPTSVEPAPHAQRPHHLPLKTCTYKPRPYSGLGCRVRAILARRRCTTCLFSQESTEVSVFLRGSPTINSDLFLSRYGFGGGAPAEGGERPTSVEPAPHAQRPHHLRRRGSNFEAFTWKPRPESGCDCLTCAKLSWQQ